MKIKTFKPREVSYEVIASRPHSHIVQFLDNWASWKKTIDRNDLSFKKSKEEYWTGNKMRKMSVPELLNGMDLLRLQYQEGVAMREVDLDFVQEFEDYLKAGMKPTNSQRWRLGMLLIDYMEI